VLLERPAERNTCPAKQAGPKVPVPPKTERAAVPTMPRRPASRGGYRLNAQQLFLTFPKPPNDLKKEDIISYFDATYPCEWIIVGRELHKDGTPHFHIACRLLKKMDTTNPREFDWIFEKHGDYQAMRSKSKSIGYCCKDGDFIAEGIDIRPYLKENAFEKALIAATIQEGLQILRKANAGDYMKNLQKYEYALGKHHPKPPATCSFPIANFIHPFQDLTKALLIWGKSGCGKTQFALAHFKAPLEVCHIDSLRQLDTSIHDGIVFNDMSFHDLPRWTPGMVISLLDMNSEAQLDIRYGYAIIPKSFPRIFTYNEYDPFTNHKFTSEQKEAVTRRINRFAVLAKLYDEDGESQVESEEITRQDILLPVENVTSSNTTTSTGNILRLSGTIIPREGRGTIARGDEFPTFEEAQAREGRGTGGGDRRRSIDGRRQTTDYGGIYNSIQARVTTARDTCNESQELLQDSPQFRMDGNLTQTTSIPFVGPSYRMGELTGGIMCPHCFALSFSGKCPKCQVYI